MSVASVGGQVSLRESVTVMETYLTSVEFVEEAVLLTELVTVMVTY